MKIFFKEVKEEKNKIILDCKSEMDEYYEHIADGWMKHDLIGFADEYSGRFELFSK